MPESSALRPKLLVVDDTPANLVAMRRLLARVDAEIIEAGSGAAALKACLDNEFALILLDVQMPDIDGFEVAGLLADQGDMSDTPVIFVTAASTDELNRLRGYSAGAVDYITKPINDAVLLSKVNVFLDLHRSRQQLQQLLATLNERNAQLESEIAERKRVEELVRHQATHDGLTGLPNRMLFMDRLKTAMERARRRDRSFAVVYVDIDGFKPVNDTHGHGLGDELLKGIAGRLRDNLRAEDTVARLGGDEFAIVMEETGGDADSALRIGEQLCGELRQPFKLSEAGNTVTVQVGASLGIALFPTHAEDLEALLRAADHAMYAAKRGGKNACVLAQREA